MTAIKKITRLGFPWQTQDPFIFCVYHHDHFPKGNGKLGPDASLAGRNIGQDFQNKDGWNMYHGSTVPGFPAHPHCGFETVTVALKGLVDHSDSLGAAGRFGNGDVQWMTAGKGVQHSEMFPLLDDKKPNELLLFQIWLNLPKKNKKAEPHFAMLWSDTIPNIKVEDQSVRRTSLTIIAGKYEKNLAPKPAPDSWAADPANEVMIWIIEMAPNATFQIPSSEGKVNRSLYFYGGESVEIDSQTILPNHAIELDSKEKTTIKNGGKSSYFLLLQGKPIDEPVVQYGPFVTNSNQEVQQVLNEFQRTQFGGWPWPKHDHTHEKSKGRFALHADGRLEEKSN